MNFLSLWKFIIILPIPILFISSYVKFLNISIFHYSIFLSGVLIFFFKKLKIPRYFFFYVGIFIFLLIYFYFLNYYIYYSWIIAPFYYLIFFNIFQNFHSDKILKISLAIIFLSLLIAIAQSLNLNFFWNLRYLISEIFNNEISYQLLNKQKASGLAYNNIQFQYHIFFGLFLIEVIFRNFKLKLFLNLTILFVSFITNSFSLMIIISIWLILNYLSFRLIILYFAILIFIYLIPFDFINIIFDRLFVETILIRLYLSFVHLIIFFQNPLGVPLNELYNLKSEIYLSFRHLFYIIEFENYINEYSHNNFINIGLYAGIIGFLLHLYFFVDIFINNFKEYRYDKFKTKFYFSFFGLYLIFMISHNSGPFFGDPVFWLMFTYFISKKNEKNFKKFY